jgi:group II intron reverse transcriptase/maturase
MVVGKMQTKLARWSQDQTFEFDDIYNIVCSDAFLREAWLNVSSNRGARTPGVDGTAAEDYAEHLNENLEGLRQSLKSGTYRPKPVRRVYIPKGPDEVRPLGIPTMEDRVVQESLRLVMEPIYETDFAENSFGFRPNRSCHDALQMVSYQMAPSVASYKHWILDLDVKGYFDNVSHTELMYALQDRITDSDVQDLIWQTLKAGVKENGSVQVTGKGTPQGGVVSPLLANVYLNELDQWIQKWTDGPRSGEENWTYVRYADDFLIMTNGRKDVAEDMMEEVEGFLAEELHLELSQEKSSLTHAQDGLSFLGYNLHADSTSGGCKKYVPQEAKDYIRERIKEATDGGTNTSAVLKIRAINSVVRGWANYYKYCTDASKVFGDVNRLLWHRITDWLAEKHDCSRWWLLRRKLDSKSPIKINGQAVAQLTGLSTHRTEDPKRHNHPYLEEERDQTLDSRWGDEYRTRHPGQDPYLANEERRAGSADKTREARLRDRNVCQVEGCRTGGWDFDPLPVHHIRRRKSKDDDRLRNLVTLCEECHRKVHLADETITAYHEGRDELLQLS